MNLFYGGLPGYILRLMLFHTTAMKCQYTTQAALYANDTHCMHRGTLKGKNFTSNAKHILNLARTYLFEKHPETECKEDTMYLPGEATDRR